MRRLTHSLPGYRRSMQMLPCQLFIFVEGQTLDPYFYGEICRSVALQNGIAYCIVRARELPDQTGGKLPLIALLKYLRRRKSLIDYFKGKLTISFFYLDKDIDDFLKKKLNSDHLIYTTYYDVENHIFSEADLSQALAAAASLDSQTVRNHLRDHNNWRRERAEIWKEWITLCLFCSIYKIRCECSYTLGSSRINSPLCGSVDMMEYKKRVEWLERKSGMSADKFKMAFSDVVNAIESLYKSGQHDIVFKGKWYAKFMAEEAKIIAAGHSYDSNNLENKLPSCAALTLDFNQQWAEYFKEPLRRVIARASSS